MNLRITDRQRKIAGGAAALIAVLLWVQASRVGIEDTPWLIGVMLIAALLFAAFGKETPAARPTLQALHARLEMEPTWALKAAYVPYSVEFLSIARRSSDMPHGAALMEHAKLQAMKLAWMTVIFGAKMTPTFKESSRLTPFKALGLVEFRSLIRTTLEDNSSRDALATRAAATELSECLDACTLAQAALLQGDPKALNPLFRVIEKQFPYAAITNAAIADEASRLHSAYSPLVGSVYAALEKAHARKSLP